MLEQIRELSQTDPKELYKKILPTRALALLMGIGFIDLFMTAILHSQGRIVELNPVMRPLIEQGEWLFALVKGATLVAAWIVMARYAKHNMDFVRKACIAGSAVYLVVWTSWFFAAS